MALKKSKNIVGEDEKGTIDEHREETKKFQKKSDQHEVSIEVEGYDQISRRSKAQNSTENDEIKA